MKRKIYSCLISKIIVFCVIFTVSILITYFTSVVSVHAQTLFLDQFNGTGDLQTYNNSYQQLTDYRPDVGSFYLMSDHLESYSNDPSYVYTAIPAENVCASIDFNWTGGYSSGHWTQINLFSTANNFVAAFQVRDDNGNSQRWLYYGKVANLDGQISFDESQTHTVKACTTGTIITGYLDGNLLFVHNDASLRGGYMGFASQEHTYYLDNFKIEDSFPAIPTPSPTPSPTPTPTPSDLSVPGLKQTDNQWGNQVYDSAYVWSPNDTSIYSYGCALTSGAMILQYYGITTFPSGGNLNPGTLNTWLKNQPDGYVGDGFVNWLALSRLSKQWAEVNHPSTFDGLEFSRMSNTDVVNKAQLTADITSGQPDILEEPGHFIVAKGIHDTSFSINDPYFPRLLLTDGYTNTFNSLLQYKRAFTNLSYIFITLDPTLQAILKDSHGNIVARSYVQQPLRNESSGITHGNSLGILYLPQPLDTDYSLQMLGSTTTNYTDHLFLYDVNGNVLTQNTQGVVGNNASDSVHIHIDTSNTTHDSVNKTVSPQSMLGDIAKEKALHQVNSMYATMLTDFLKLAMSNIAHNKKVLAKANLKTMLVLLNTGNGKGISASAYSILLYDVNYLLNLL